MSRSDANRRRVARTCENDRCGKTFRPRVDEVARGWGRFCSRSCKTSVMARQQHAQRPEIGERNRNFKNWASRNPSVYVKRFQEKYPEKAQAHRLMHADIAKGALVRPDVCQRCEQPSAETLHGHHEDYSKPLVVVFCCRSCHRILDAERQQREALAEAS